MKHLVLTVQHSKNCYRGVYKNLKINNAYKVISLQNKRPVQTSSLHRCLQALGLQWNGSKVQSHTQDRHFGQRDLSDVHVWSHPARHLTAIPGAETLRVLKLSLICIIAHPIIFVQKSFFNWISGVRNSPTFRHFS